MKPHRLRSSSRFVHAVSPLAAAVMQGLRAPVVISKRPAASVLLLAATLLLAAPLPSWAQSWTGATSSDWFDGTNWDNGQPPTATTQSALNTVTPNPTVIDGDDAAALTVSLGGGSGLIGSLSIINGGTLVADRVGGGVFSGQATVVVRGVGSSLTTNALGFGTNFGTGTLSVMNGGTVTVDPAPANSIVLLGDVGGTGSITVSGSNSTLSTAAPLFIGRSNATGVLAITAGGAVDALTATLGELAGGQGHITVEGSGSTLSVGNALIIGGGDGGTGTLTIENGATADAGTITLGQEAGAQGTLDISDVDSHVVDSGTITIGASGTGILKIANGATLTSSGGPQNLIGLEAGSTGTATITGAGSRWTAGSALIVGRQGTGGMTVSAGGKVSSTLGVVGDLGGSQGTVTITGPGSSWNSSGVLYVGNFGQGTMTVADGGSVTSSVGGFGGGADAVGTVTVEGTDSRWDITNALNVGNLGTATLTVGGGAAVTSGGTATLGLSASGTGKVAVSGSGSTLSVGVRLAVGSSGTGTLAVSDGGLVASSDGRLGDAAGGQGAASISGSGSAWNLDGDLSVGYSGTGALTIADGGAVSNRGGIVGYSAGTAGTATVTGAGSKWVVANNLQVGRAGSGELLVADGGALSSDYGFIADARGSTGTMTVTGPGSIWSNNHDLVVGNNGSGELAIADGGVVSAAGGLSIAQGAGVIGTLDIGAAAGDAAVAPGTLDTATVVFGAGTGTINFNHTGTGYEFAPAIRGNGTVDQIAGTTILTGTSNYTGATAVSGGTLRVEGALGDTAVGVEDGATLGGSGSIAGPVTIADGGTIAPGSSAGTLTVGSLALNGGSILDYELGQAGAIGGGVNDLVEIDGDLTLDGRLDITDIGGFGVGVYRLMNYDGTLTDRGLDLGTLPTGSHAHDLFVQTAIDGQVNLVDSVGLVLSFWDGSVASEHDNGAIDDGDGTWNAGNDNWTAADGAINGRWDDATFAVFGGAGGSVDVVGEQGVAGIQFMAGYSLNAGANGALRIDGADSVFRVDPDVTATIGVPITGSGGLVKTDAGTLVLAGTNTYTGGTRVDRGTLQVAADANLGGAKGSLGFDGGTLRNTAAFTSARNITLEAGGGSFRTDRALTLTGTIDGAGRLTKSGTDSLTLTGASTYTGGTMVGAGTLRLGDGGTAGSLAGDLAIASGGTFVFDRSDDIAFDGVIDGTGTIDKRGGGTLLLDSDSSGFAGTTKVSTGTLQVDGSLGGLTVVTNGAMLRGTGTLGSVDNAGTLAPGNSIGTLSVDGDYTNSTDGVLQAEVAPDGSSDLLKVTGRATLEGGTVDVVKAAGHYDGDTRYTLIDAAGGVEGTFDTLIQNTPFLNMALGYDTDHVYLNVLRNSVSFCEVAATRNQCATGTGAESTGAGSPVYDAIAAMPDEDTARTAFDELSGESYASTRPALLDDSRFVREAMDARLHRAGTARDNGHAIDGTAGTFWTHAWGHWGRADGDGNAVEAKANGSGLLAGIDAPLGDHLRGGLTAGAGGTSTSVATRHSDANSRDTHVGAYLGGTWGGWKVDAGVASSWHDITSHRTPSLVLPGRLSADYKGRTLQAFVEGGYRFTSSDGSVEPYVNATHVAVRTGEVNEHGSAAALHGNRETTEVSYGTLGVHGQWHLSGEGAKRISAYGTLGWRHAFGDTVAVAQNTFVDGERFTVAGVPWARDALMVQAGVDFAIGRHTSFAAGYSGMLSSDARDHAAKVSLRVTF